MSKMPCNPTVKYHDLSAVFERGKELQKLCENMQKKQINKCFQQTQCLPLPVSLNRWLHNSIPFGSTLSDLCTLNDWCKLYSWWQQSYWCQMYRLLKVQRNCDEQIACVPFHYLLLKWQPINYPMSQLCDGSSDVDTNMQQSRMVCHSLSMQMCCVE